MDIFCGEKGEYSFFLNRLNLREVISLMQLTSQTIVRAVKHNNERHSASQRSCWLLRPWISNAPWLNALSFDLAMTLSFPHQYFDNKILHMLFLCIILPEDQIFVEFVENTFARTFIYEIFFCVSLKIVKN